MASGFVDTAFESDDSDLDEKNGGELELWCYEDPNGESRGPFQTAKMLRWRPFFERTTVVWPYGSEQKISFEDFMRIHRAHPLWTYFDEENEPLIQLSPREDVASDSDNENYDYDSQEVSNDSSFTQKNSKAEIKENLTFVEKSVKVSKLNIAGGDEDKKNSDSTNSSDSSASTKSSVNPELNFSYNVPDFSTKLIEVKKGASLQYTAQKRDIDKENLQPLEEIQNPQNSRSDQNIGTNTNSGTYFTGGGGDNWTSISHQAFFSVPHPNYSSINYYRAVPPPLPVYLACPPPRPIPSLWPMRAIEPFHQPMTNKSGLPINKNLMNYPPTPFYTPPATFGNIPLPPPQQNVYQPPINSSYSNYQANYSNTIPTTSNSYSNYPNYQQQNYQSGTLQELQSAYRKANSNDDKNLGAFCENLIEKYMNITGQKMQELYRRNEILLMQNEELKSKVNTEQKPEAWLNQEEEVSFAKIVREESSDQSEGRAELKSFWDSIPKPQAPTGPQKKVNKYPAGFVGEGSKKKKAKATGTTNTTDEIDGIEDFIDWSINTLDNISGNKLNTGQLREVLKDMDSISCVERYIKVWLEEDVNPKIWNLYSEKLKKYRQDGASDELNSPARANSYEIEKSKQKEKLQKKAELYGSNKDLNTINISRHISKIQQGFKK